MESGRREACITRVEVEGSMDMKTVAAAVVTSLALFAGGCQDTVKAPFTPGTDPLPAQFYPAITLEPALNGALVVDPSRIVSDLPTAETPLRVQVPLRSMADRMLKVQYEFQWFDAQGREVGRTGFKSEQFPARQQVMLSGNAMRSDAVGWRLEVRRDLGSDF
jgi:uncharacterized protein YcfL